MGWAAARAARGTFVLRIEDIDRERCRPEFEQACLADLRWLGLDWDEGPDVGGPCGPYRQSERFDRFDQALAELAARGRAYPCACSRADVRAAQRAPHLLALALPGRQQGERAYPGTCRPAPGREPKAVQLDRGGLRLDVMGLGAAAIVAWHDRWAGAQREDVRLSCGDFLLGRPGAPTYQLAVVVDDAAMGITDVVRGRDLLGSTGRQVLLHRALTGEGPPPPLTWAHHPLLLDDDGRKLSKRDRDVTLAALREDGADPGRVIAAVAVAVGLLPPGTRRATPDDLVEVLAGDPAWRDGALPPAEPLG